MKKDHSSSDVARFRMQFMNLYRRLRREAQSGERSWARLVLLGAIDRFGDTGTPSAVARAEGMRSSNLAAMLRELDADGLIVRTRDVKDGRKVRLKLTARGQNLLYANRARRDRWLSEALQHCLTEEDRKSLFQIGKLLDRIAAWSGNASTDKTNRTRREITTEQRLFASPVADAPSTGPAGLNRRPTSASESDDRTGRVRPGRNPPF